MRNGCCLLNLYPLGCCLKYPKELTPLVSCSHEALLLFEKANAKHRGTFFFIRCDLPLSFPFLLPL